MNTVRSAKSYYFAAFLFGAVIAFLIAAPMRGAVGHHDASTPPADHVVGVDHFQFGA
jgi:hypothetical protein